ncbi:hypothetical protein PENTCL1PPCAC_21852, partial [Pristionchus entomophagus]
MVLFICLFPPLVLPPEWAALITVSILHPNLGNNCNILDGNIVRKRERGRETNALLAMNLQLCSEPYQHSLSE